MATRKTARRAARRTRSIVSVVFNFSLDTLRPIPAAIEYTYFCEFPIKEGDVAVVLSPRTYQLAGVLVTNVTPGASAIRRATKGLVGKVDMMHRKLTEQTGRRQAIKEAWDGYDGGI